MKQKPISIYLGNIDTIWYGVIADIITSKTGYIPGPKSNIWVYCVKKFFKERGMNAVFRNRLCSRKHVYYGAHGRKLGRWKMTHLEFDDEKTMLMELMRTKHRPGYEDEV